MATTALPEPSFIDRDPAQVTADLVTLYEQMTGKTLQPAQPERIFIDVVSYRESLLRVQIQQAALANLVAFAPDSMLDYLGQLVDCSRLPAIAATTIMEFTLVATVGVDTPINAGTETVSKDGLLTFATDDLLTIPAGQLTGSVAATAETAGTLGNGYLAGDINNLAQPIANVAGAVNTTYTSGGSDIEGPDHYRARIMSAPESFSVAGPVGAYKFWAMSANQTIIDVAPVNGGNGNIYLYILTSSGAPSADILSQVAAICSADTCRPLNDIVQALTPVRMDYDIMVYVTLYSWSTDTDAQAIANITKLLAAFAATQSSGLGLSVVIDQIKNVVMGYRGVYCTPVEEPAADMNVAENGWSNCTGISVTINPARK